MKNYIRHHKLKTLGLIPLVLLYVNIEFSQVERQSESGADSLIADTLSADSVAAEVPQDWVPRKLDRTISNGAFKVGEKLTFAVRYGFITAGHATMEVEDMITVRDSFPAYKIVTTAQSTSTFDLFFKVRDRVESVLDSSGIFSWEFRKYLREGGYKFDLSVEYDQVYGKAYVEMIRYHNEEPLQIRKKENFELPVPKYVIDVLGAFYYVRTQELRTGEPIFLTNHDNKKIYDLKIIVQKRERIKVKAGEFNCIVVQPMLEGDAIFKQKGKLWVWLTDDELKIPVQMKSKAFIGSVVTELIEIEGIDRPIAARVK